MRKGHWIREKKHLNVIQSCMELIDEANAPVF